MDQFVCAQLLNAIWARLLHTRILDQIWVAVQEFALLSVHAHILHAMSEQCTHGAAPDLDTRIVIDLSGCQNFAVILIRLVSALYIVIAVLRTQQPTGMAAKQPAVVSKMAQPTCVVVHVVGGNDDVQCSACDW